MAIQVYDLRAKTLPDIGLLKVRDAETGHEMYIDTSSKKMRLAHTRNWMYREEKLRDTFAKVKWTGLPLLRMKISLKRFSCFSSREDEVITMTEVYKYLANHIILG